MDRGDDGSPPGLPQLESALHVGGKKDILYSHLLGAVFGDDRRKPFKNLLQASGKVRRAVGKDGTVVHMNKPVALLFHDTVAGDARTGVDAEDPHQKPHPPPFF